MLNSEALLSLFYLMKKTKQEDLQVYSQTITIHQNTSTNTS